MRLASLIQQGGFGMMPIYLCSLLALTVFLKKFFEFQRAKISDWTWLEGVLGAVETDDLSEAAKACGSLKHPGSRVVSSMISVFRKRPERVEAEASRVGSLEVQQLERHLGLLSFVAQTAPLLGLLGTVVGMVQLFMGLEAAGIQEVDVERLSSGIWQALLTTAAGLLVAVPSLAGHAYLSSKVDTVKLSIVDAAERVLTALPRKVASS